MLRRVALALLVALALAALGGCGDDDGGEKEMTGLAADPTKDQYIAAADEVCQHLYEQRDPVSEQAAVAAQRGDTGLAADAFDNAADITDARFAELANLPRPAGDEARLGRLWERGAESAALGREAAAALRQGEQAEFARAAQRGAANTARLGREAVAYGFLVCGRGAAVEIG